MIISFNGDHGAGKSTIAKKIASTIDFDYYCTGAIFRELARERGLTLIELLKLGEKDKTIDNEVDDRTVLLAKEKDDFVIDSRLAWYFIPQSFKIFLKVDEKEAARRMFEHKKNDAGKNRENEDKKIETVEDVLLSNRRRKETDRKRYKMYYGVDIWNEDNYDFVVDTTGLDIEKVFNEVLEVIKMEMVRENKNDQ